MNIVYLALAGAVGTLCRYGATIGVHRLWGEPSPLGTMTVNMVGCFLFGAAWAHFSTRSAAPSDASIVVLVGFMGAFTTFSSLAFDSMGLFRQSQWFWASANLLIQNVVGVGLLMLGIAFGKAA